MKNLNKPFKSILRFLFILLLGSSVSFAEKATNNGGYGGGSADTQVFDTSFAVEFSYSCLGGGCHETDQNLVNEYTKSKMTHTMVKCNACHGTHTAETAGLEKPNLTGYYPGIGATGYSVHTDRCKTCHNNEHSGDGRKKSSNDCYSCHAPHVFSARGGGAGRLR